MMALLTPEVPNFAGWPLNIALVGELIAINESFMLAQQVRELAPIF